MVQPLIIFFSIFPFFKLLNLDGLIANVDFTQFFLLNTNFLDLYPYVWKDYLSGIFNSIYIINWSSLVIISAALKAIGLNTEMINRVWLVTPFILFNLSVFYFINKHFKKFGFNRRDVLLIVMFTAYSSPTVNFLSIGWQQIYFLPAAATIILLDSLISFSKSLEKKYLFVAGILSIFSAQLMHLFIFANICFFLYLVILDKHPKYTKIKTLGHWSFTAIFINLWWVLPLIGNFVFSEIVNYRYDPITDLNNIKNMVSFQDVIFLNSVHGTTTVQQHTTSKVNLIIRTSYFLAFTIGYLKAIKTKKTRKISLTLGVVLLVVIFFSAGAHQPFGSLFVWAFKNIPMFYMFRDVSKFGIFIVFIYGIFITYLIKTREKRKRNIVHVGFLFLIAITSFPMITGNLGGDFQTLELPDEYLSTNILINKEELDAKLLALPMPRWTSKFTWMDDEEKGSQIYNPLYTITSNPIIFDELNNTGLIPLHTAALNSICAQQNNENIFLSLLNIKYIIFQKDQLNEPLGFCPNEQMLKNVDKLFTKVREAEYINLYQIAEDEYLPHFYIPVETVYSTSELASISEIQRLNDYQTRTAFFFKSNESTDNKVISPDKTDSVVIEGVLLEPAKDAIDVEEIAKTEIFYPHVKNKPSSPRWHVGFIKERYELSNIKDVNSKLEKKLFFANKRISEIQKWGNISVEKSRPLFRVFGLKELENLLDLWQSQVQQSIDLVIQDEDKGRKATLAKLIKENYSDNLKKLAELGLSELSTASIKSDFDRQLSVYLPETAVDQKSYRLNTPISGEYSIYLETLKDKPYASFIKEILIDDTKIDINLVDSPDQDYQHLGEEYLDSGEHTITIKFNNEINLLPAERQPINLGNKNRFNYQTITDWLPNQWYQVSGNYELNNGGVELAIEEEVLKSDIDKERDNESTSQITKKVGIPPGQGTFKYYVKSGNDPISGGLSIEVDLNASATINDLSVTPIYEPKFIIRSRMNEKPNKSKPVIAFQKINPTKYRVEVRNATEPYLLVFSENYNRGWNVFKKDDGNNTSISFSKVVGDLVSVFLHRHPVKEVVTSYFDGDISEYKHRTTFLEPDTFETWDKKPIATDQHYLANSYANSWYISPDMVGGDTEYELIIEFIPQRLLYIGIFISVIFILIFIIYIAFQKLIKK